jgi:hypothetical protein
MSDLDMGGGVTAFRVFTSTADIHRDRPHVGWNAHAKRTEKSGSYRASRISGSRIRRTGVIRRRYRTRETHKTCRKRHAKPAGSKLSCSSTKFQFRWDNPQVIYSDFTRWTRFGAVSEAATFAEARNDPSRVTRRGAEEARVISVER